MEIGVKGKQLTIVHYLNYCTIFDSFEATNELNQPTTYGSLSYPSKYQ
jgi:hypothetical protein